MLVQDTDDLLTAVLLEHRRSWARFRGVSIRTSFLAQRETRTAWGLVLASVRQMHADHADRDGETLLVRQRLRTIEVAHVHRVSLLDLFLLDASAMVWSMGERNSVPAGNQ